MIVFSELEFDISEIKMTAKQNELYIIWILACLIRLFVWIIDQAHQFDLLVMMSQKRYDTVAWCALVILFAEKMYDFAGVADEFDETQIADV